MLKRSLYTLKLKLRGFKIRRKYTVNDIPVGDYCYKIIRVCDNGLRLITKPCPFSDHNPYADDQSYGYCHKLRCGDWQSGGTFILWDGCKECGINIGDGDE